MVIRRNYLLLLMTFIPAFIVLSIVAGMNFFKGVPIYWMTRDLVELAGINPLAGALQSIGVLLWWTSASIWLFFAALHWKLRSKELFWFALFSGLLSTYLAIDDLFCIHEILAQKYLGIPEKMVYGFLLVVSAIYLIIFRERIFQMDSLLLLLAFAFLGCSVFIDAFLMKWLYKKINYWAWFIEDGAKWLGIVNWCGFCITKCYGDALSVIYGLNNPARSLSDLNTFKPSRQVNPAFFLNRVGKGD